MINHNNYFKRIKQIIMIQLVNVQELIENNLKFMVHSQI